MIKRMIFCAVAAAVVACAGRENVIIEGTLDGVADGAVLELLPGATHKAEDPVAQATVADGRFRFEAAPTAEPRLYYIRVAGQPGLIDVMAAPGDRVTVKGTFSEPVVAGSRVHDEYVQKYVVPRARLDSVFNANRRTYDDISRRMGQARSGGDPQEIARIEASDEWRACNDAERQFFAMVEENFLSAVRDNADTWWGPFLMLTNTAYFTPDQQEVFLSLSDAAKESYYGRLVEEELFPKGLVGEPAPTFAASDRDGTQHTLAGLLQGNRYLLIDFWASWCGPCRKFVPQLKEIAAQYAGSGLAVVSISCDKDRQAWLDALEEEQMPWINLIDTSGIMDTYGVSTIPSLFLIGEDGKVLFGKLYGDDVTDQLATIIGQ